MLPGENAGAVSGACDTPPLGPPALVAHPGCLSLPSSRCCDLRRAGGLHDAVGSLVFVVWECLTVTELRAALACALASGAPALCQVPRLSRHCTLLLDALDLFRTRLL